MENSPEAGACKLVRQAEAAHRKIEAYNVRLVDLGRQQLEAVFQAGQYLLDAKDIVGHGHFKKVLDRWRMENVITFSDRSGRRYMRLAKHAEAIKMANVANLREAEKYVANLEHEENEDGQAKNGATSRSAGKSKEPVELCEAHILNNMRRLDPDKQRTFLEALITKLTDRLQSLLQ
jgi:alkyl hydroperoxide reductase subunit AhpF